MAPGIEDRIANEDCCADGLVLGDEAAPSVAELTAVLPCGVGAAVHESALVAISRATAVRRICLVERVADCVVVVAQPFARPGSAVVMLGHQRPEALAVAGHVQVRELVHDDVVEHLRRRQHQAP